MQANRAMCQARKELSEESHSVAQLSLNSWQSPASAYKPELTTPTYFRIGLFLFFFFHLLGILNE